MNEDKLEQMKKIYETLSEKNPGISIEYKSKTKVNPDDLFADGDFVYDEGVEGVDFNYDKHGNKWAIVRPENHPARQQEYRPERKSRFKPQEDTSLLDSYDPGIFKTKTK